MILVSDNESFNSEFNRDDQSGEKLDIPTVIIKSSDGQIIKDYVKENPNVDISMTIFFETKNESNKVFVRMFMRSDDPKSLHFFSEFREYFEILRGKILFFPYYKYYECEQCEVSNSVSEKPENSCIKSIEYCGYPNSSKAILFRA